MPESSRSAAYQGEILIVDDSYANLVALGAIVGELDVEVVTAESGKAALEIAAQHEFAVVLLDVMMPEMDGLATLERMRMLPHMLSTPVIFMTARDPDRATIDRAYELGAADYIYKPIEPNVLRAKLRVFINSFRQAQALELKDRHMGVLAHDLRTPLSTVAIAAARLAEHEDPSVRTLGTRIARAAQRMDALTNDVLEFARASASQLPLELGEMDLVEMCRECIEDFEVIHPTVRFWHELPQAATGSWDRARLQQALSNLLGNAVKYGTGWVRLRVEPGPSDVEICVENAGTIAPENLERLFMPFERGTREHAGVGLGLYIVRAVARAHGGDVEAVADEKCTMFRLLLPLSPGQDEASVPKDTVRITRPGTSVQATANSTLSDNGEATTPRAALGANAR
jgi:signal transduction histidine kinase